MSNDNFLSGINDFEAELAMILEATDENKVDDALEMGAGLLAADIRKLPKPRSQISKSGYTHLLDSVNAGRAHGKVVVGWGKYYGPILEHGSSTMQARPHLKPTWEKNKESYQREMIRRLKLGGK